MAKEVPQIVKLSLRSVLLSCQKGIKQTSIEKDYYKLTNSNLDVKKYGYQDLYEFLLALPDVARLEFSVKDGENKVFGVAAEGVYMSDHAKKAEGIPNGLKPLPPSEWPRNKPSKERTVARDKSSLKVTVESDEKRKILPNARGLYGLHIKNLPPSCQENEISRIFKQFRSLREVKIENSSRIAFVRFSNYADAVQALSDMDGYSLRGTILKIHPATERNAQQNAKGSKDKKEESKMDRVNKNRNKAMTNGFVDKEAVVTELKLGSSLNNSLPSPKEMKTALSEESWEIDGGLSPKMVAKENGKFFNQDNFVTCVNKEDGFYPIHVSNFPAGTTQEELKQSFCACGDIAQIKLREKFAFISFTKQEGAVTALQKMKGAKLGDKFLTVTPKTSKGKAKQQDNSSVGFSALNRTSSQSSVSSSDSLTPQLPRSHNVSAACSSGNNSNGHAHTECNDSDIRVNGYRGMSESCSGQRKGSCSNITDTSNSIHVYKVGGKLEETETASCSSKSVFEKGCSSFDNKSQTSLSVKQSVHVHNLLTYLEMCELLKRCKKPVRTLDNIGAQEFDILVTDIVDSCHFWANIDDKIGSYKELEQIRNDLQFVEHHSRCMPVKYQLGASLFSEDKKWYRCWCLEVSNLERKEAKVIYIDYGNCEWISWDRFTDIHKRFWDLAPQAVPFKLAGLENASSVSPEILNEGSKYLSALIINKVCRARTVQPSDPSKPHVIEVELIVNSEDKGKILVNKQMALTRYVQETRKSPHEGQGQLQNHSIQEINQTPGFWQQATMVQPPQPAKQMPPRPSVNIQNVQLSQAAVQHGQPVKRSVDQELLPRKQAQHSQQLSKSSQANSLKNPVPSPQSVRVNQQSLPNQNMEPVEKSMPEPLQQQQLPSYVYQLFDKKEVIEVIISYVVSPDEIYFFLADKKTRESLQRMTRMLSSEANPNAEIYPRVGDIVTRIQEKPVGEKMYRVRIKSIPKSTTIGVVDKVVVQNVDYGWTETVPLRCLCELPPSLGHLPPQVMQAKLAGIQKRPGLQMYPDIVKDMLVAVKKKRKMIQASVVKRQENGILLVELFESEGPSLNVQLLKMDCVQLDESLQPLLCSNFTSAGLEGSGLSQNQRSSNLLVTTNQNPRWHPQEKRLDRYSVEVQSNHSDWEDSLLEIEEGWVEATPLTGACKGASERQSPDHLYMPPPPETPSSCSAVLQSSVFPSQAALASSVSSDVWPPSSTRLLSSMPLGLQPPSSTLASAPASASASASMSNAAPNVRLPSSEGSGSSVPLDVRPPSSSGSESSDVHCSHTSLKNLSNAVQELSVSDTDNRTALSREEKILQDKQLAQSCLEKELVDQKDAQDWWQEKKELIQKDEELKRILDMPRSEMMKMISLRQEKEKLERKIRIKGLENQILKLQKELKQLELEKGELEGQIHQK